MSEIRTESEGRQWLRATHEERELYLIRACKRLADLGIAPPSFLDLDQCMTAIAMQPANADLDVGRLFQRAIAELQPKTS